MIALEDARARVLAACLPLPARSLPLADALGRVLAGPVVSGVDVPPFANTAMDGFAVRAADTADAPVGLTWSGPWPPAPTRPGSRSGPARRCGS